MIYLECNLGPKHTHINRICAYVCVRWRKERARARAQHPTHTFSLDHRNCANETTLNAISKGIKCQFELCVAQEMRWDSLCHSVIEYVVLFLVCHIVSCSNESRSLCLRTIRPYFPFTKPRHFQWDTHIGKIKRSNFTIMELKIMLRLFGMRTHFSRASYTTQIERASERANERELLTSNIAHALLLQ